jgi:hypothetical protein
VNLIPDAAFPLVMARQIFLVACYHRNVSKIASPRLAELPRQHVQRTQVRQPGSPALPEHATFRRAALCRDISATCPSLNAYETIAKTKTMQLRNPAAKAATCNKII